MLGLKFGVVFFGVLLAAQGVAQNSTATSKSDSTQPPVHERVRVSEILISTPLPYDRAQIIEAHQKAEEVLAAIRRDGNFASLARMNSQGSTAAAGGDIGYFTHGMLARSLDETVFRMKVGDVSDVVRVKQGFVILKVTERLAANSPEPKAEPAASDPKPLAPGKSNPFNLSRATTGEAIQQASLDAAAKRSGGGQADKFGLGTGSASPSRNGQDSLQVECLDAPRVNRAQTLRNGSRRNLDVLGGSLGVSSSFSYLATRTCGNASMRNYYGFF